jgi:hypothetical protein
MADRAMYRGKYIFFEQEKTVEESRLLALFSSRFPVANVLVFSLSSLRLRAFA